jgi:hypothetical protein
MFWCCEQYGPDIMRSIGHTVVAVRVEAFSAQRISYFSTEDEPPQSSFQAARPDFSGVTPQMGTSITVEVPTRPIWTNAEG